MDIVADYGYTNKVSVSPPLKALVVNDVSLYMYCSLITRMGQFKRYVTLPRG